MKKTSLAISIGLILGSSLGSQLVSANPNGAQVVQGTASFSNPSANVLNINNSRNAIINWQSFNIGAGQTTNFIQPSATSSVLNRVITNNPSQILGNLNSNGRVFLINQHGILVGEGASINTAGFFGSTLNITDADFLNGKLKFEGGGQGDFENQGYIHAGEDGSIILIAPNIENGGVIEVDNGNIILAAGQSITITSLENSAIQFEITSAENKVTNLGQIIAKNGAASLFAGTLEHSGSIRATGLVQNADGSISLVATDTVVVSGSVDVTGDQGGNIEILGDVVDIQHGANIDASGTSAGGEILIGGDQQGLNPEVKNSTSTTIAKNAEVHADATQAGDGGKVIIFAENDVHVHGNVTAKGGQVAGDGGFIETSGLQQLDITSVPDASATNGKSGEWLIDPNNITLVNGTGFNISGSPDFTTFGISAVLDVALIEAALLAGNNVTVSTGTSGLNNEDGDIFIYTSINSSHSGNASLTFNAHDQIFFDTQSTNALSITSSVGSLDLTFNSDSDANGFGDISFLTGTGNSFPLTIDTNGGNLVTNGDVTISGESFVDIVNTRWVINSGQKLSLSGFFPPVTLQLTGTTVLQNDGDLDLTNGNILGDTNSTNDKFINNGEIFVGFSSTDISTIDTTTLSFIHNGLIEISDLVTLNLTSDGSQALLSLIPGSSLLGGGTLNADVSVDGGILVGGDSYSAFGALTINGDLTFNSGLFYTVVDAPDGLVSSSVSAASATINGGDLMVVWDSSFAPGGAFDGSFIRPINCGGFADCLTGTGFTTVVNPITVTQGKVLSGIDPNFQVDTVTYEFTTLDPARFTNIITWASSVAGDWNVGSNWSGGVVPTAADYVFIENSNGPAIVNVSTLETFKGLQSEGLVTISSGGNLVLGGDAFILDSPGVGNFGLTIAGAGATVSGSGVLYVAGPDLILDQGILQADVVNWGAVNTTANTSFQIDSNFVNNALFDVFDNAGINSITGSGSFVNNAVMKVGANFETNILFDNKFSGLIDIVLPGVDFSLTGSSNLDGVIDVKAGSTLSLSGGTHTFVDGMSFTGDLNVSGGVIAIEGGLTVDRLDLSGGVIDVNTLGVGTSSNSLNANILSWGTGNSIISGDTSGSVTGILDITSIDTLNIVGTGDRSLIGITVNNAGTINYATTGDFLFLNNGTVINNNSQFLIQGDLGISSATGSATIFNNGSMFKTAGTGTSLINVFTNHSNATIDTSISGGNITFTNGGQLDGSIISKGTGFTLAGGVHTFVDGVVFSNELGLAADLNVTTGTMNVEGGLTVGTLNLSGGVLDIDTLGVGSTGAIFNANTINWSGGSITSTAGTGILNIGSVDGLNLSGGLNHILTGLTVNHDGQIEVTAVLDRLSLSNTLMTTSGTGNFIGLGSVDLQAGSDWTVTSPGQLMPVAMTLDLNGGNITNVENLIFPGTVNVNQFSFLQTGTMTIPDTTTFNYFTSDAISPSFDVINDGLFIIQSVAFLNLSSSPGVVFTNNGTFEINSATTLDMSSDFVNSSTGILSLASGSVMVANAGAILSNSGSIIGAGSLSVNGGELDITSATTLPGTMTLNLVSGSVTNAQNLILPGVFNWLGGTVQGTGNGFTTQGQVTLTEGTLLNTDWTIAASGIVDWIGAPGNTLALTNASIINQGTFNITSQFALGALDLSNNLLGAKNLNGSGSSFINQGTLLIDAGVDTVNFALNFDNVGGDIGIISGNFSLNGADLILDQADETLKGFGTFTGNVINTAGTVSPGFTDPANINSQTGTLTIVGDYTQGVAGALDIKMDSSVLQGLQHDVLDVSGIFTAGGSIDFKIVNGASVLQVASLIDTSFSPISFGSFANRFDSATIPPGLNFELGDGGVITITSDNPILNDLNDITNQLEVLLSADDLDFSEMVQIMRFIDQRARVALNEEEEDEETRGPRLVCK